MTVKSKRLASLATCLAATMSVGFIAYQYGDSHTDHSGGQVGG